MNLKLAMFAVVCVLAFALTKAAAVPAIVKEDDFVPPSLAMLEVEGPENKDGIEDLVEAETYADEPSMLRAAIKRMKYERKFSASLYAFNGIPECLKLRLESGTKKGCGKSELSKLQNACNSKNIEEGKKIEEEGKQDENSESSSAMGSNSPTSDGELSIWCSLDLPPICFVN